MLHVEFADRIGPEHLPNDSLSIVVFGPGTGEALLLKLPGGQVCVVDGCRRTSRSADPVRDLVSALGIERLFFACLTHPHEDHFGGLADLVDEFDPEHLLWAGTEHERLLEKFAAAFAEFQRRGKAIADGVSPKELHSAIAQFVERSQRRGKSGPRSRAQGLSDHKLLLTIDGKPRLEIWGVLPTTTALHRALGKNPIRVDPPSPDQEPLVGDVDPNDISAALLLSWGAASVLLGGDVLAGTPEHHEGWSMADWIPAPAQIIKVAHHASKGAHYQPMFDRLKPSVALVTPFRNAGGKQPPREDMLELLAAQVEFLILTSRPAWWPGVGNLKVDRNWDGPRPLAGSPIPGAQSPTHGYGAVSVSIDSAGTVQRIVAAGAARRLTLSPTS